MKRTHSLIITSLLIMSTFTDKNANAQTIPAESTLTTEIINPEGLYDPAPYGYSHAVIAKGGSRIAYIAGQGGEDSKGNLDSSFSKQVKAPLINSDRSLRILKWFLSRRSSPFMSRPEQGLQHREKPF
ncbi:hypothetical protein MIB92_16620 [Aestuariirhabdus sp. Z084]|uniref:hypothetical protein n=1 Tax=Aestuariirhabdus haliotis TaxID=2918751 RepID=UPI00201B36F5|nr:hypothetical protein [Aestuariirhabdus haliotis]MCL6417285.1 hypothetical protein [Aestuariirhabdus haliotis]MCL6421215.1 hypothetical protein [Aestuariirhabdus haliotis]